MITKQNTLRFALILAMLFAGVFLTQTVSASTPAVCPDVVSVTASSSYLPLAQTPEKAFDCNDGTSWNAGTETGTITAEFASELAFDGFEITTTALPETDITYHFSGSNDGVNFTPITDATLHVYEALTTYPVISVPTVSYKYLRVSAGPEATWIAINELRLHLPPVNIYPWDGSTYEVSSAQELSIHWAWEAMTQGQLTQFLRHTDMTYVLTDENGTVVDLSAAQSAALWGSYYTEPVSSVEGLDCGKPTYSGTVWNYDLGALAPGEYTLTSTFTINQPVNDGFHTCTFEGEPFTPNPSKYNPGEEVSTVTIIVSAP